MTQFDIFKESSRASSNATSVSATRFDTDDLAKDAIASIRHLLATDLVAVGWSGGKDSSAALVLALRALQQAQDADERTAPLLVLHNDTEIENPAVRTLADEQLEALQSWADAKGLPIMPIVSRPSLSTTWAVKVLGGKALPRWPGGSAKGDCATDWKRTPATGACRDAMASLEEQARQALWANPLDAAAHDILTRLKRGGNLPVVILGSRRDESAARAASVKKHGQDAIDVTNTRDAAGKLISRTFSPLLDWSVLNVWELLAYAGTDGTDYPVWMTSRDFAELNNLYKDATGTCTIIPGPHQTQATACGARFGCWNCQKTGDDKSLNTMLLDAKYRHLERLSEIRDFTAAIRWDLSRRSWIGRKLEDKTAQVKVQPDTLSDETLETIALSTMAADHNEAMRALMFRQALNKGEMPRDPFVESCLAEKKPVPEAYLRRMQRAQFLTLDPRKIIALDFTWSVLGRHGRPFHALALYDRIWVQGEDVRPPRVSRMEPVDIPAARWLPIELADTSAAGLGDPLAVWAREGCTGTSEGARLPDRCGNAIAPEHVMGTEFDVDEEAARMVLGLEWPNRLKDKHQNPGYSVTEGALYYLRMGIVQVSSRNQAHFHRMLTRTQSLEQLGLLHATPDTLVALSKSAPAADDGTKTPKDRSLCQPSLFDLAV